ncbi:MAG: PHP-associated domain-containing protein [archaeon]
MKEIQADLHMHGPIGFEPYWMKAQGYEGKNPLKLMTDACLERGVTICAVTSESDQVDTSGVILRNTIHDRLGFLANNHIATLPLGYQGDRFGDNSLVVAHGNDVIYFINGQTVNAFDQGRQVDHLVIGSNTVPNGRSLDDTISYCSDYGLSQGLEHPDVKAHFGVGLDRARELADRVDFIEGHNAQMRWPAWMRKMPKIGAFTRYSNEAAQALAQELSIPWIATSDAHRIRDAGIAHIILNPQTRSFKDEDSLLSTLRDSVRIGAFETHQGYESVVGWLNWVGKFQYALIFAKDREAA